MVQVPIVGVLKLIVTLLSAGERTVVMFESDVVSGGYCPLVVEDRSRKDNNVNMFGRPYKRRYNKSVLAGSKIEECLPLLGNSPDRIWSYVGSTIR